MKAEGVGNQTSGVASGNLSEEQLAERAKQINNRIKKSEKSQRVTSGTLQLQFDEAGGKLWHLNHPNN